MLYPKASRKITVYKRKISTAKIEISTFVINFEEIISSGIDKKLTQIWPFGIRKFSILTTDR